MGFDFSLIAERRIQQTIDEGVFDDLPGKGQPLHLDDLPPHLRILRNAGVLPDWMQLHLEIGREKEECARAWERTVREYARYRVRLDASGPSVEAARRAFAGWLARTRADFVRELRRVNDQILKLNLQAPDMLREHIPFRVAEEEARFDAAFPPLPGVHGDAPIPASEPHNSALRGGASLRYRARGGRG